MLSLAKHYQVQTVAILASNDNTGFDFIQYIKSDAATSKYSMVVGAVYTYDVSSISSMTTALESIIQSGVKTVFVQVIDVGVEILTAAYNLRMLDGSYWLILTSGFDSFALSTSVGLNATSSFSGIWQLELSRPYDFSPDGTSSYTKDLAYYFEDLYGAKNNYIPSNFNPKVVSLTPLNTRYPSGCQNSSQLNFTSSLPNIAYNLTLNSLQVPFYVCIFVKPSFLI
jgi:hypothetical protein